ncbi:ANTAR domain-containing protein [Streptomyces sp. NPDC052040]|uniref:ANTAR domain-containing protein n=1 Tax=Streptomyces sp. NPDC052040 TaxID=3365682 RepID=UPI0037D1CC31
MVRSAPAAGGLIRLVLIRLVQGADLGEAVTGTARSTREFTMAFFAMSDWHPLRLPSATELAREHERLVQENAQLRQAVASHALIDQAMGAVVVFGQIPPEEAWRVLRDVSQRTNTKLRVVAEHILGHAQGAALPEPMLTELHRALERYRICSRSAGAAPPEASAATAPPASGPDGASGRTTT